MKTDLLNTDLVEAAAEHFGSIDGVSVVEVRAEIMYNVDISVHDDSRKARQTVYDVEWELRQKFSDAWIRVHFT